MTSKKYTTIIFLSIPDDIMEHCIQMNISKYIPRVWIQIWKKNKKSVDKLAHRDEAGTALVISPRACKIKQQINSNIELLS